MENFGCRWIPWDTFGMKWKWFRWNVDDNSTQIDVEPVLVDALAIALENLVKYSPLRCLNGWMLDAEKFYTQNRLVVVRIVCNVMFLSI